MQNLAGDVGGEEGTKRVLWQGLMGAGTALPGRAALPQHAWELEKLEKLLSAVSVQQRQLPLPNVNPQAAEP